MNDNDHGRIVATFADAAGDVMRSMLASVHAEDQRAGLALSQALKAGSWLTLETSVSLAGVCETHLYLCAMSGERVRVASVLAAQPA